MEIKIKVVEGSRNRLIEDGNRYVAKIKQDRVGGMANRALVQLIAKHFDIDQARVKIIKGKKKTNKVIFLEENEDN